MRNYSLSDLRYITPSTLRSWFSSKLDTPPKYAIVDVRDSDYIGGHIKDCLHYPSRDFSETLPKLRQALVEKQVEDVVFHCALSQVRGPKSALRFVRSIEALNEDDKAPFERMRVWVLQGGFTSWQQEYGNDTMVTEGYLKDLWE